MLYRKVQSGSQQRKPPQHFKIPCFRWSKFDHFPSLCRCRMCRLCIEIGHIAIMCPINSNVRNPVKKIVGFVSRYENQRKSTLGLLVMLFRF